MTKDVDVLFQETFKFFVVQPALTKSDKHGRLSF
jgi:hypothetical protein